MLYGAHINERNGLWDIIHIHIDADARLSALIT